MFGLSLISLLSTLKSYFGRHKNDSYEPPCSEEASIIRVLEKEGRLTTIEIANKAGFNDLAQLEDILFSLWGDSIHRWPNLANQKNPYWALKDYASAGASFYISSEGHLQEGQRQTYPPVHQESTVTQP